ncbi:MULTISPECIES: energy-coupling factor transporter transmembrane component T family protein [Romboutsia]|uniref:energy-coupling factor transporter transmembrane component T family protein n=1 Tax=Romboutsia TaxID=1501226 RepID=UPI00189B8045|nr:MULTISPECIES: energy-coupling factor transporter transmembrane component T [Romboutsia]MCH1958774.1 energy-coupling factor transporter transmembrane protein EcfT [Romboutsia hominis]MCH1970689.1 energy-coupling factor transporter transmembrane protein EcfT [Romboutsia hominis]MDB8806068.1 energy-coupling factor transporter transmembrane component T [Romboutsia sp. 1001216sp1]MDB8808971.1 energy-coupling factor transporter transmembrane component T [Romboutsia sp. 1001216sp1]MDB8811745.1 ene
MLKDITIGQYYPVNSVIHKLDARVKLIATFVFMISLFIINKFWPYAIVLLALVAIIKSSKLPGKYILKGLKPLRWIIIFTFVINVFFLPGDVIWSFGFLRITSQGLEQAIFMAIRLIFLVVGTSLLTLTTTPMDLTDGIERLLNPLNKVGFPVHELAMMMTIALRFIPTLLDETDKIMKAQMSRGADFESKNLINRAKNLVPLLVPLFVSAFRRAEELAAAMEARCYRGGYNRTKMKQAIMTKADYVANGIQIVYLVIIIATRFM